MTNARRRTGTSSEREPHPSELLAEQVPANSARAAGKASEDATSNETWRELALRIQNETDSKKVIDLTQRLIAKLDSERMGKTGTRRQQKDGSDSDVQPPPDSSAPDKV